MRWSIQFLGFLSLRVPAFVLSTSDLEDTLAPLNATEMRANTTDPSFFADVIDCYSTRQQILPAGVNECRSIIHQLYLEFRPDIWNGKNLPAPYVDPYNRRCAVAITTRHRGNMDAFKLTDVAISAWHIVQRCKKPYFAAVGGEAPVGPRGEFFVQVYGAAFESVGGSIERRTITERSNSSVSALSDPLTCFTAVQRSLPAGTAQCQRFLSKLQRNRKPQAWVELPGREFPPFTAPRLPCVLEITPTTPFSSDVFSVREAADIASEIMRHCEAEGQPGLGGSYKVGPKQEFLVQLYGQAPPVWNEYS